MEYVNEVTPYTKIYENGKDRKVVKKSYDELINNPLYDMGCRPPYNPAYYEYLDKQKISK